MVLSGVPALVLGPALAAALGLAEGEALGLGLGRAAGRAPVTSVSNSRSDGLSAHPDSRISGFSSSAERSGGLTYRRGSVGVPVTRSARAGATATARPTMTTRAA